MLMIGGPKATHRQTTTSEEMRVVEQEDREVSEELHWYEEEELSSPFAVRSHPTHEELERFFL